jgi:hypothetical protein
MKKYFYLFYRFFRHSTEIRHLCFVLLLIFFGKNVLAANINVTTATITSALSTAADGDVLLLVPGTYSTAFGSAFNYCELRANQLK